jgi:hypothetical protein
LIKTSGLSLDAQLLGSNRPEESNWSPTRSGFYGQMDDLNMLLDPSIQTEIRIPDDNAGLPGTLAGAETPRKAKAGDLQKKTTLQPKQKQKHKHKARAAAASGPSRGYRNGNDNENDNASPQPDTSNSQDISASQDGLNTRQTDARHNNTTNHSEAAVHNSSAPSLPNLTNTNHPTTGGKTPLPNPPRAPGRRKSKTTAKHQESAQDNHPPTGGKSLLPASPPPKKRAYTKRKTEKAAATANAPLDLETAATHATAPRAPPRPAHPSTGGKSILPHEAAPAPRASPAAATHLATAGKTPVPPPPKRKYTRKSDLPTAQGGVPAGYVSAFRAGAAVERTRRSSTAGKSLVLPSSPAPSPTQVAAAAAAAAVPKKNKRKSAAARESGVLEGS